MAAAASNSTLIQRRKKMRSSFDVGKYLSRPDEELYGIYLAIPAFLCALGQPHYKEATRAVSAQLRLEMHPKPRRGRYVKGYVKCSLDEIPDLPRRDAIAVDFKKATIRRVGI